MVRSHTSVAIQTFHFPWPSPNCYGKLEVQRQATDSEALPKSDCARNGRWMMGGTWVCIPPPRSSFYSAPSMSSKSSVSLLQKGSLVIGDSMVKSLAGEPGEPLPPCGLSSLYGAVKIKYKFPGCHCYYDQAISHSHITPLLLPLLSLLFSSCRLIKWKNTPSIKIR